MIRRLTTAWTLALVGSLLLPLVSIAAVSDATYDLPSTATTAPATIAEQTASVETVSSVETSLRRMTIGHAQPILGLSRILDAAKKGENE